MFTVCLVVNHDLLWKRILCRLEFEPERKQYNEDSRKWMEETSQWYENFTWDYVVDNSAQLIPPRLVLSDVLREIDAI